MHATRYIRASQIFVGNGDDPISDGTVEIQGERITNVGSADDMQVAPDAHIDHYPQGTILPGLVDSHVHLTLAADRRSYEDMARDSDEMMVLIGARNAARHLAAGVTTVRDNGARNQTTFVLREAVERGYLPGPRLLLSGRPITHTRGHFHWCNGVADGPEHIRRVVRQLVAEGADHIKIMASGGGTQGSIGHYPSYTVDELRAAVDTAHTLGRLTTAHCRATQSMANAVQVGSDSIEHAEFHVPLGPPMSAGTGLTMPVKMEYDPRLAKEMLSAGTYVGFTFQAGGYEELLELRSLPKGSLNQTGLARREQLEKYFLQKAHIFSRYLEDGFQPRLAISSDAGPYDSQFGHLHYGLGLAVKAGYTPRAALEAATRIPAEQCGVAADVGTLQVGKRADILVVRGDVLADIDCISTVLAVYQSGERVNTSAVNGEES